MRSDLAGVRRGRLRGVRATVFEEIIIVRKFSLKVNSFYFHDRVSELCAAVRQIVCPAQKV